MKTKAVAIAQDHEDAGFRPMPRASRNASMAVMLALVFGLASLAGTTISLAF